MKNCVAVHSDSLYYSPPPPHPLLTASATIHISLGASEISLTHQPDLVTTGCGDDVTAGEELGAARNTGVVECAAMDAAALAEG